MLTINTNLASLIAQGSLTNSTNLLNQAIERMTTGFKINGAKDNAANYSISTNMSTRISSYMVAEDNASTALDLVSTASSSLDQMSDHMTRLRSLATQAANGTYGDQSLEAINQEANAIIDEIERLYNTTEYNGISLFRTAGTLSTNALSRLANSADITTYSTPAVQSDSAPAARSSSSKFIEEVEHRDTSGMTKLADVDENTTISSGTYSISTADELAKLATMTNSGKVTGGEFVLSNDIDLSAYSSGEGWIPIGTYSNRFSADFDGNGYVISNLYINYSDTSQTGYLGIFGATGIGTIKNLGIEDASIINMWGAYLGVLIGDSRSSVENVYSTGDIQTSNGMAGGLIGTSTGDINNCFSTVDISQSGSSGGAGGLLGGSSGTISNCYATGDVSGTSFVGGIVGSLSADCYNSYATGEIYSSDYIAGGLVGSMNLQEEHNINNCYSSGTVSGVSRVGGLIGQVANNYKPLNLENVYVLGESEDLDGIFIGQYGTTDVGFFEVDGNIQNAYYTSYYDGKSIPPVSGFQTAVVSGLQTYDGPPPFTYEQAGSGGGDSPISPAPDTIIFQVGINSDWASQIGVSTGFSIDGIEDLRDIGLDDTDYLLKIDEFLASINDKQTEFGAVENRLMSVLEEISIQYDNLVSSRSTLRDADISEVSSEYIRQQILQEASATLLAAANQSPAIALQLI